jgi:hypothetical protein
MALKRTRLQSTGPDRAGDLVNLTPAEVSAVKAMGADAMAVIEKLCGFGRNPFRNGAEEGRRDTDYYCGKLSIAHILRDLRAMKLPSAGRASPPSDLPNS